MNRGYLALGIGAAIVAAFVLYVVIGTHDADSTSPVASHRPAGPRNSDQRSQRPPPSPRMPSPGGDPGSTGSDNDGYTVGNVTVRDHRVGDHPQVDVTPSMNAPGGRKIPSKLTFDVSQQLRPLLAECGARTIPKEARGAKPRFEGSIQIEIKGGRSTVTQASFQLRDVTGDFDGVKTCVEQKSVGVSTPAPDEADLASYSITMSLQLP